MKIGYARVSAFEQNLDLQIDALKAAGIEEAHIHTDKLSCIRCLAKGMTNYAIAQTLEISEKTVEKHLAIHNKVVKQTNQGAGTQDLEHTHVVTQHSHKGGDGNQQGRPIDRRPHRDQQAHASEMNLVHCRE
jgi:hypothetical protein